MREHHSHRLTMYYTKVRRQGICGGMRGSQHTIFNGGSSERRPKKEVGSLFHIVRIIEDAWKVVDREAKRLA